MEATEFVVEMTEVVLFLCSVYGVWWMECWTKPMYSQRGSSLHSYV